MCTLLLSQYSIYCSIIIWNIEVTRISHYCANLQGELGDQGDQGAVGEAGPKGGGGPQGAHGESGETGPQVCGLIS